MSLKNATTREKPARSVLVTEFTKVKADSLWEMFCTKTDPFESLQRLFCGQM